VTNLWHLAQQVTMRRQAMKPIEKILNLKTYTWDIFTKEPLGLRGVLERLRALIECDILMLVSRHTLRAPNASTQRPRWTIHEFAQSHGPPELRERLTRCDMVHQLLEQMRKEVAVAGGTSIPIADATVDDAAALAALRQGSGEEASNGSAADQLALMHPQFPELHNICAGLLGHVMIGDWALGETMLVAANGTANRTPLARGIVQDSFVAFWSYVAEVNSHFHRKGWIDKMPLRKRSEYLSDEHVQAGYLRSACRLAPLLDKDIGVTVETVVLIQSIQKEERRQGSETKPRENEPFPVDKVREELQQSHYCLRENVPPLRGADAKHRRQCVEAMWDWAELLQDVQDLQANLRSGSRDEGTHQRADVKSGELMKQGKILLERLPKLLWTGAEKPLRLNAKCLAGFFIAKLAEYRRGSDGRSVLAGATKDAGIHERLLFLTRLADVAQLALDARRPDAPTLQAMLWLVCEYAHEALRLDRQIDLESRLALAAMEQPALYGLKRFYRDHLFHVIQVCLTGWLLLDTKIDDKTLLDQVVAKMHNMPGRAAVDRRCYVLRQWFVASLLHDMGYVVEVGKGLKDLLERFHRDGLTEFKAEIERGMEALSRTAVCENWGFDLEDKPGEDHGVVSALYAEDLLDKLDPPKGADGYSQAIQAMAHHNHDKARIEFSKEPLSVLLVLCDELQEWDRPWMDLEGVGMALVAAISARGHALPDTHQPLKHVEASLDAKWKRNALSLRWAGKVLKFELSYGEDVHRHDGIFSAWLGRSRSLQRIDLARAVFNVRYTLVSDLYPPVELERRHGDEPQMERLRRLVRERRVWGLEPWLPGHDPKGNGVTYKLKKDEAKEIVTLDVKVLGKSQPIRGSLKELWKAAEEWSGAWDGRDRTT
jgi:hypothetical protein